MLCGVYGQVFCAVIRLTLIASVFGALSDCPAKETKSKRGGRFLVTPAICFAKDTIQLLSVSVHGSRRR